MELIRSIEMRVAGIAVFTLLLGAAGSSAFAQGTPASVRPTMAAPRAAPACQPVGAGQRGFVPVPMQLAAEHVEEDPAGVWTKWNMWNPNNLGKTTIWQSTLRTCSGDVIVSQIVNRQCSSDTSCPTRVVMRDGQQQRTLMDYKQVCTLHATVELRGDLTELRACGQAFALVADRTN